MEVQSEREAHSQEMRGNAFVTGAPENRGQPKSLRKKASGTRR